MTVTTGSAPPDIHTPTVRQAGRLARFWIVAAIGAILLALITLVITGAVGPGGQQLSATNAAPSGSKAIAEVLRARGVTVTATDTLPATHKAAGTATAESTTIFVVDDGSYLDGKQLKSLSDIAGNIVIMTPSFEQLLDAVPEVAQAGAVTGTLRADCALAPVNNAGEVTGEGSGYRLVESGTAADTAVACLGSGDMIFSLIQVKHDGTTITVIGLRTAFTNEHVAERGNAALALNLLGATDNLVWYLPSITDSAVSGAPTLAELTPGWVSAVLGLLMLVAVAAAVWRARRLGPLVVENLPVVVRASETMEGRARLYQRSSARLRALDTLRMGSIARLATLCGLSRLASVDDVILAVAATAGQSPQAVAKVLRDALPGTDAELVRLSDALLTTERATEAALRPNHAPPGGTTPDRTTPDRISPASNRRIVQ